jgi:hypothetical protein
MILKTRAGEALAMVESSTFKKDIVQSLIAPGTLPMIPVNELLVMIQTKCGLSVAKAFKDLVLQKIEPKQLTEEDRAGLLAFCQPRKDLISKECTKQLEKK